MYIIYAINHAIETVIPTKEKTSGIRREVSEHTESLYKKRTQLCGQGTAEQYREIQREIKASALADFEHWVDKWATVIDGAEAIGDTRGVHRAVKVLGGKPQKPSPQLATGADGKPLGSAEDVATAWHDFLKSKFSETEAEQGRPPMEPLPCTQGSDPLNPEQFLRGLSKMRNGKASGPDGIPVEIFKKVDICRELLFELIYKIWDTEEIPASFARAKFVMLFKNKGSPNDPTKYRCIGLLTHAYKVLAQCLLERLECETKHFLSDWQAGFRKKRGCRDNVLTLRAVYDEMLERGEKLYATFIDYSAAFDSVSHKFLDRALKRAGASNKTRSLFRAIYRAASAYTEVNSTDDTVVKSQPFPVDRGVIQGDILSPLFFILALELILKYHDNVAGKGVKIGTETIYTLGYADDAVLLDVALDTATARVTSIAKGSRIDADMDISIAKTQVMQVAEQDRVPEATPEEARGVSKYKCPNVGCNKVFFNIHGCKCHAGKCSRRDYYPVEKLLAVRGELGCSSGSNRRQFLVKWKDYGPEHNSWQDRKNIDPELINSFLHANNLYDHSWPGRRCPHCDLPCKNAFGVKVHLRACNYNPTESEQNFKGTCAAKKVHRMKLTEAQKDKRQVECEGKRLENVYIFKYLGSQFAADGDEVHDVKRRVALATSRMGELRNVFNAKISLRVKLRIYKTAVCSLLTYGCEAWHLSEEVCALINGANARLLSRFTHKSAHEEASPRTRTYDLLDAVRRRRLVWLGHILRMQGKRLVKFATAIQFRQQLEGDLFDDIPSHFTYDDIQRLAQDRVAWKQLVLLRGDKAGMTSFITKKLKTLPPLPTTLNPAAAGISAAADTQSVDEQSVDEQYRHFTTSSTGAAAASAVKQEIWQEARNRPRAKQPSAAEKKRRRGLKRKRAAARKAERTMPKRRARQTVTNATTAQDPTPTMPPLPTKLPKEKAKKKSKRRKGKKKPQQKNGKGMTDAERRAFAFKHFQDNHPEEWQREQEYNKKYPPYVPPKQQEPLIDIDWDEMVASANENTTPSKASLWAAPCVPPSPSISHMEITGTPPPPTTPTTPITTTSLWAEPCVPPSPSISHVETTGTPPTPSRENTTLPLLTPTLTLTTQSPPFSINISPIYNDLPVNDTPILKVTPPNPTKMNDSPPPLIPQPTH
mgnify:CR=1 FL=1